MIKSFVKMPPLRPTHGMVEDSWAKVWSNYLFLIVPTMHYMGNNMAFYIRDLIPVTFSIARGRAKSIVLTSSLSAGGGDYSRVLQTVRS